ncbi:MAG: DUF3786 domain-containing protein [Lachnospiraceae bacterium]|nr:DUF3786 domain-containing protein [Lachnospiraceae bacterium]
MESRTSNYMKVMETWRKGFLTWDQEALCRKLGIDTYDKAVIRLSYFGIPHEIDRKTGRITCPQMPGYDPGFNEVMAIYNFLYYAKEGAKNSGEWVHLREVKDVGIFEDAFERQVLAPFAKRFAGRGQELKEAGERMGFLPLSYGDVSFQIPAFFCVPLRMIFWDGDEEFPAKVNLLFDRNITSFTHPESVVMLGAECMRYFTTV